eukprot:1456931-Rhodomonas_salina.3
MLHILRRLDGGSVHRAGGKRKEGGGGGGRSQEGGENGEKREKRGVWAYTLLPADRVGCGRVGDGSDGPHPRVPSLVSTSMVAEPTTFHLSLAPKPPILRLLNP